MELDQLQDIAEKAWTRFQKEYQQIDVSPLGDVGSALSPGNGMLRLRSEIAKGGRLHGAVTESLSGSGQLPDTNALLSCAESTGVGLEGFISTVLSLMFQVEGTYWTLRGENDLVSRIFAVFHGEGVLPTTLESTPLRIRTTQDSTPSPELEVVSNPGSQDKLDLISNRPVTAARKRKRSPKKSSKRSRAKASGRKRRK